jgi:uncharacterized protein DUF4157
MLRRQCGFAGNFGAGVPPIVHDVLKGSGEKLPGSARANAEQRFGQDLSHVRVHASEKAAASASSVGALAYSVGPDIVFGAGQFAPSTKTGEKLLTHELAHSVQQPQRYTGGDLQVDDPASPAEREAEAASRDLDSPSIRIASTPNTIHRQTDPPAAGTTPADFGISLVVVDHGAGDAHAAAEAKLQEIYGHLRRANLAQLKKDGVTSVELHIIPEDQKIIDLPEFKHLKGTKTPDGRIWDDVRGAGGNRFGSRLVIAIAQENLVGTHHHGLEIGLGIGGGLLAGAGGAAIGAMAAMGTADKNQGKREAIGGIVGGLIGSALGALGGYGLGAATKDKYGEYSQNFLAAHETSHSVEDYTLTPAQHIELQQLFAARTAAKGPWLAPADYTSSNIHEYFAQCAAAFFRKPYQDAYKDMYTPEWLDKNDNGMYKFLQEVFTSPDGNAKSADVKQGTPENHSIEKAAA